MGKQIIDIDKLIDKYRFDVDLLQKIDCTKEENKQFAKMVKDGQSLPDGVFKDEYGFFRYHRPDLSNDRIVEYLLHKQLGYMKGILYCMVFFVVLAILAIVVAIIL